MLNINISIKIAEVSQKILLNRNKDHHLVFFFGKEFLEFKKCLGTTYYIYAWEGWEGGWKILEFTWFSGGTEGRSVVSICLFNERTFWTRKRHIHRGRLASPSNSVPRSHSSNENKENCSLQSTLNSIPAWHNLELILFYLLFQPLTG